MDPNCIDIRPYSPSASYRISMHLVKTYFCTGGRKREKFISPWQWCIAGTNHKLRGTDSFQLENIQLNI